MNIAIMKITSNSTSLNNSDTYFVLPYQIFSASSIYLAAVISVNLFLSVVAVLGNSAVLTTIWKNPSLHSPANILLANLAVSDLAVGLVGQPLFIAYFFSRTRTDALVYFICSSFFCGATFLTITAISFDRLLALQLHLRYHSLVTTFRVNVVVLLIWLVSAFFSSTFVWNSDLFYISISPVTWTLAVGNFVVYLKIFLVVRRHQSQIHLQQQGRNRTNLTSVKRLKKSAFNTFLVFILLVCCYLPYSLYLADVDIPYSMVVTMFFLNSSLNPLVYCWRVRDLRSAMKRMLSSCL